MNFRLVILLNLVFLCSCATEPSAHRSLPAEMPINKDAGRGGFLMVTVQLENGQKLPFVVDTGASCTVIDKSLVPKLGKSHGTFEGNCVDGKTTFTAYTAPKLYLEGALLTKTNTEIAVWDVKKRMSPYLGRPVMGMLGIDVLEHYCIQLDFAAGKMRFLDDQRADKSDWGKAFPIVPLLADDERPAVAENLTGTHDTNSLIDSGWLGDGWLMPKHFQQWTNDAASLTNGEVHSPDGVFGGEKYPLIFLSEEDWPSDGMGLNFLARHLVTLDFPNHTLYLKRQSTGPRPGPKMPEYRPIPDREPQVTAHLRAMVQEQMDGTAQADDYTAPAWKNLLSKQKDIQEFAKYVGEIVSMTLVERSGVFGWRRSYRYRIEFTRATVLAHFVFHGRNKLASGQMTVVEWKEPAD